MSRERQLRLFGSRQQRGTVADYSPSEFQLQCAVADTLKRWSAPDWIFGHIPLGEYRTPSTAKRLKRMGTTAGWADMILLAPTGRVFFLELKRRDGRLTEEQQEFACWCVAHGIPYAIARNFDEALRCLKAWGAVRGGMEISA